MKMAIRAELVEVGVNGFALQHDIYSRKVDEIMSHVTIGTDDYGDPIVDWTLPPVLVVESEGNGCTVLDGHHRLVAAKKLGLVAIPGYQISVADYCKLVETHFGGSAPNRYYEMDEYIILPDGSRYQR